MKKKKQDVRIVKMSPVVHNEKREPKLPEKQLCQLKNCLEEVYQDLNELDEIIDQSFGAARK